MAGRAPILVLGRSGQLATCLRERAAERGIPLRAAGRGECDIVDAAAVARLVAEAAPRLVVNAAAYTAVDAAESDPAAAFAVNRDGAAHVAAAAAQARIPLIHVSTDYVFDGSKTVPYVETDAPAPLNQYGRSKLAGETAVLKHPAAYLVRTSWVYAPFGRNFVTTMLSAADREQMRIVDDQRGRPTAAEDLAEAILTMADTVCASDPPEPGIYHAAGAGEATWRTFAERIFAGWRRRNHRVPAVHPGTSADYAAPARRPAYSVLDCGKLARAFGIRLPPWEESLEHCLDQIESRQPEAIA